MNDCKTDKYTSDERNVLEKIKTCMTLHCFMRFRIFLL